MATVSLWQRTPRIEADVAVVGGGVIGTATAWALGRLAPDLRVVIVEAERLAFGASGRNAGFLLLGTVSDYTSAVDAHGRDAARRIWAFTREAYELSAEVGARHDVGFQATGSVIAAGTDAEADRLRRSRALLSEDGVETRFLDGPAANAHLGSAGYHGLLVVPTGGVIDPARLVRALAAESGAEVVEGWRATAVESEGGRVRLAADGGGEVVADRVLVATNAFLPQLLPTLADVVRPVRAQMLATAPAPPTLAAPVYSHDGYFYLRQRPDGRVLLGGARHLHRDAEVGPDDATTDALQADLARYLATHFPSLADVPVERRWSGPMGFSPDGLPVLGAVPGVPGARFAAGFTGHGMAYALRFGSLAARTLLDESDPALDLFHHARLVNA
ncbi:NAD(P)/FAD-dependent oxidoreductase [Rubrivirga sp.]|uniref:NAD(P)/FAD-dependent oxidoreductase n=1 Tax=Rubrivirga sp. TaxID=1885344 RepID=UPI003B52BC34